MSDHFELCQIIKKMLHVFFEFFCTSPLILFKANYFDQRKLIILEKYKQVEEVSVTYIWTDSALKVKLNKIMLVNNTLPNHRIILTKTRVRHILIKKVRAQMTNYFETTFRSSHRYLYLKIQSRQSKSEESRIVRAKYTKKFFANDNNQFAF